MATLKATTIGTETFEVLYPSAGEGKPAALRSVNENRSPLQQQYLSILTNQRAKGRERECSVLFKYPIISEDGSTKTVHFQVTSRIPQNATMKDVAAAFAQFKLVQDDSIVDDALRTAVTPR